MKLTQRGLLLVGLLLSLVAAVSAQDAPVITVDNAGDVTSIMRLGRGMPTRAVYSPDGATLAVASSIGVWLYDAKDVGATAEPPLLPSTAELTAIAYSPDGSMIAVGDYDYALVIWDVAGQEVKLNIDTEYNSIYALAFSPDNSQLALGSGSGLIRIYDTATGELVRDLQGHSSTVYALAFNADGSVLASGSGDYTARLWDVAEGAELHTLEAQGGSVYGVAFSPDGKQLLTVGSDDYVYLWDATTADNILTIDSFEDDAGEAVSYTEDINAVAWMPDGSGFVVAGDDDFVRSYDIEGEAKQLIRTPNDVESVVFSPDGSQIATVGYNDLVQVWDAASGDEVASALGHTSDISALAWSPDSASLLIGSDNEHVWLWTVADMKAISELPASVGVLTFSADNTTSLAFAPDGSYIVFTDGFVPQIWEPDLSAVRFELVGDGLLNSIAISADSKLIASVTSQDVYLYDAATGDQLIGLPDHTDWVYTVAFSPDGKYLATGGSDGTVRVWGVK